MLMGWVSILVFAVVHPGQTRTLEEGLKHKESSMVSPSGNERLAMDGGVAQARVNLNSNRTSKE